MWKKRKEKPEGIAEQNDVTVEDGSKPASENDEERVSEVDPLPASEPEGEEEEQSESEDDGYNAFERLIRSWVERSENLKPLDLLSDYRLPEFDAELSTDQLNAALGLMLDSIAMLYAGELSVEMIGKMLKAVNYDEAVERAETEGEIRGRNAVIVEEFRDLRANSEDDGIPRLGGSPGMSAARRENSIFDLARDARQNYYPL